jgi:RNA polymerase sigma-70 factor (ECF subfamily)
LLYDLHGGAVYSVARRIVGTEGDAEEVTQEVFLYAWEKSDRFDAARGSMLAWLLTLARSRAIDRLRQRRSQDRRREGLTREVEIDLPAAGASPERMLDLVVAREAVKRALDGLPREQREPIEIAYFEGLSQSEIATRLEAPLGTIKTRMRQGMMRLRDAMRPLLAEESR